MLKDAISSYVLAMRWVCVEAGIASAWDNFDERSCGAALRGPLQAHISRNAPVASSNGDGAELRWSNTAFLYCEEIAAMLPVLAHPDTDYRVSHRGVDTLSLFLKEVTFRSCNESRQRDYERATEQVHTINDTLWRKRYDAPHAAATMEAPVPEEKLRYNDPRLPIALGHSSAIAQQRGVAPGQQTPAIVTPQVQPPTQLLLGSDSVVSNRPWPMSPGTKKVTPAPAPVVTRAATPARRQMSPSRAEVSFAQAPPVVSTTASPYPSGSPVVSYRLPTPSAIHQLRHQSPSRRPAPIPPLVETAPPPMPHGRGHLHHNNNDSPHVVTAVPVMAQAVPSNSYSGLAPSPSPRVGNPSDRGFNDRGFNDQAIFSGSPMRQGASGGFHVLPGYETNSAVRPAVDHYTTLSIQKEVPRPVAESEARKTPVSERPPPDQPESPINGMKKRATVR